MLLTAAIFAIIATPFLAVLIWRWRHFSYFKNLGIPGPKPSLIWGNIREYHSMETYKVLDKWFQEYGDIFGFYNGDVPFIALKDLSFIEFVFVRNFQNFVDRGFLVITDQKHAVLGRSVMHESSPEWKRIRSVVAHSFSAAKLKQMMHSLEEETDILLRFVDKHADTGTEVNMRSRYEELSMDYMARGAFGLDERFFGNAEQHPLVDVTKNAFRGLMTGPFHIIGQSTTMFGRLTGPIHWLTSVLGQFSFEALMRETTKIVQLRRNNPSLRRPDMLQNLLDAECHGQAVGQDETTGEAGAFKHRAMTPQEVEVNAATLFASGYETTSTALSYVTFTLAKYPDVQEKVRREIMDAVSDSGSLDYDTVTRKLKYLGQVLNETLRIFPPSLSSISRQAKFDFEYNGMNFKAGTCFMCSPYLLHMEAQFWPKPHEFNPDRFSPENATDLKKIAHAPFGIGPRNCVGKRLAVFEIKYTLARLLQKYRLELGASQEGSMEMEAFCFLSAPARGPWIVFHKL
ncbi:cytochrome P450 3A14-like isoform X1 [Amblyomma americanum]